jgi:hypothetical protein
MIHDKSRNRLTEDSVFKIAAIKHSLVEHEKLSKDGVFKKYGKIINVDNKLAMDAVLGKNMEAFPDSDDEDESCDSDGDAEDGNINVGGDYNDDGDNVSAAVIDRGYTEQDDLNEEDLTISDDAADLHGGAAASFSFVSLLNALPAPLDDDDNEGIDDPVTIESVVTVDSLAMTQFNTHSVGDLRRALISFLPRGV